MKVYIIKNKLWRESMKIKSIEMNITKSKKRLSEKEFKYKTLDNFYI